MNIPMSFNKMGVSNAAPPIVDDTNYFYLEAVEDNDGIVLRKHNSPNDISLEYKINNSAWNTYEVGSTITLTNTGDKVYFRGDNATFATSTGNYY